MRLAELLLAVGFAATACAEVIYGVNLGGWLLTEPWMTPTLFSSTGALDEWHLCNSLGKTKCLSTLEEHWSTFYTRDDLVNIKNAGLTAVRIPIGYWAVNLTDYEPYVAGQYPYLIQAVQWAQELDLKVLVCLHGVPGSQDGWEESGLIGPVGFLDNTTNTDRTLSVLANFTAEFSQDIYGGAVNGIELMNEPTITYQDLRDFYALGYPVVAPANTSGINVTIHDGFFDPHSWTNYNPEDSSATTNAPFLTLDTHQFWGFGGLNALSESEILETLCAFGQEQLKETNGTYTGILPTIVGEWSLNSGVTANDTAAEGEFRSKRTWFRKLFEAQNAAFTPSGPNQPSIGWYFWAWKTEYQIDAWSYSNGLLWEYIPSNISDPSTYAFPIEKNGCIDASFDYKAPATVSGASSASGVPNAASATGTGSSSKKSSASKQRGELPAIRWPTTCLVVAMVVIGSIVL